MENMDEIIDSILNQEISIREASRITGIKRDALRGQIIKKYKDQPAILRKLYLVFDDNKKNSTTIQVDEAKMSELFWLLMNREINLDEAGEELGIDNRETVKSKFMEYVQMTNDPRCIRLFSNYIKKHNADYSNINFRIVAVDMVVHGYSQSEMAELLGLEPRTISREIKKFEKDEDPTFYEFMKKYNEAKMKRTEFSLKEINEQLVFLNNYWNEHEDLFKSNLTSRTEERIQRENSILKEVEILEEKGLTQKEIAKEVGVSVSFIRRAKIRAEQRDFLGQQEFTQNTDSDAR